MKDRLKIAVYSGDIPSTTFIERLIFGLSNSGHHIYLFGFIKSKSYYNNNVSVFGYKNTKIHKALYLLKYSMLLFLFKYKEKSKLDAILKSKSKNTMLKKVKCYPVLWHKPDIFHVQWAKGLDDWIWVKEFGIKVVLSLRGAHINYSPIANLELAQMYKNVFTKVDGFHAVSKAIAKEAEMYGAQKNKVKVIYSGLELQTEFNSKSNNNTFFEILSVGRPHWIKGYNYALDACKILKDQGFNFNYTIIGGSDNIELAYQVHDLGLKDHVQLMGKKPFNFVQNRIKNADVFLLSSLKEGIANVVLEAMALKTLVLSTNCGGINEVINDGENGFLIPSRNALVMANRLQEISKLSREKKEEIITNAVNTVKTKHSEKQLVKHMVNLYEDLFYKD